VGTLDELAEKSSKMNDSYVVDKDKNLLAAQEEAIMNRDEITKEWYERAGQSRRIWNELYKVVDSSDVVVHVLDARNPMGTRCPAVENHIRKECPHKHLIFVLNKCDLVPTWVTVISSSMKYLLEYHVSACPISCQDTPVFVWFVRYRDGRSNV
jgi:nuclear GTP-binding protein